MAATQVKAAGHLKEGKGHGPARLNLGGVGAQSVLVTLTALRSWRAADRWVTGRVLDVGCGSQPYRLLFKGRYEEWVGVDVAPSSLPGFPLDVRGDAQVLPFGEGTFDTVVAAEVLEHLPRPELFWNEAKRVLRPGGHILLSTPFLYWIHEKPNDYHRFTAYGLRAAAARAGFEVVRIEPRGGLFTVAADLACKATVGAFGLLDRIWRNVVGGRRGNARSLRDGWTGRVLLAWPQIVLAYLLKYERVMSDTVTSGYMLVVRKV